MRPRYATSMSVPQYLLIFVILWLLVVAVGWLFVVPRLRRVPGGTAFQGFLWRIVRFYTGRWHRARFEGLEHVPASPESFPTGLIVVANHTGALDPLLIQASCHFLVRWMMAADMMGPELLWLWNANPPIPVARDGRDSGPLRAALRHVRDGGAVGIFPEGRITMPPREIRPFLSGVGLIIAKTRAPVLLAWVSGTPDTNKMGEAMATRSHSRVVYLGLLEYENEKDGSAITEDLRRRIADASGWPLNDEMIPPGGPPSDTMPA